MATKNLIIPTVHLNGTDRSELIEQLADAHNALGKAELKLNAACPHARDYYVKADKHDMEIAMNQHIHRILMVREIMAELEQMLEAINEKYPQKYP